MARLHEGSLTMAVHRLPLAPDDDELDDLPRRPRTRGDCEPGGPLHLRPCPWVSCRHHAALDINEHTGEVIERFASLDEMVETCALDVADRGGAILEEVGRLLNVTRERARQIEAAGLKSLRRAVRRRRIAR